MRRAALVTVACAAALVLAPPAAAEQKTWVCGAQAQWSDPTRWMPAGVPAADDDVEIPCPVGPVVNASTTVRSLTVDAGLDVAGPGVVLTLGFGVSDFGDATVRVYDGAELVVAGQLVVGDAATSSEGWIQLGLPTDPGGRLTLHGLLVHEGGGVASSPGDGIVTVEPSGGLAVVGDVSMQPPLVSKGALLMGEAQMTLREGLTVESGQVSLVAGAVLAAPPPGVRLQGGTLYGAGTITGVVVHTGGTLAPGPAGDLTIQGNWAAGPGATLRIEPDATGADSLLVTGNAQLGGTLEVASSYQAAPGDERPVLRAELGASGAFATVTGVAGPGLVWWLYAPPTVPFVARVFATAPGVPASAPILASAPVVTPAVLGPGTIATVTPGVWNGFPVPAVTSIVWERCPVSGVGPRVPCVQVGGGPTYGVGYDDVGDLLKVTVTVANRFGSGVATTTVEVPRPPRPPATPSPPAPPPPLKKLRALALPKVTGVARPGKRLRCVPPRWSVKPSTVRYVWLRSGKPVKGRTAATFLVRRIDVGRRLACRVTATASENRRARTTSRTVLVRKALPPKRPSR